MSVHYGKVRVAECPCCVQPPVEFHSEEGVRRRQTAVKQYQRLAMVQIPIALLATLSGAISVGFAAAKPAWPFLNCFPFVNGVLMLVGGIFALKAGKADVVSELPPIVKKGVVIHYVMSVISATSSSLAVVYGGWSLGICVQNLHEDDEDFEHGKCLPVISAKMFFISTDIALNACLFIVGLVGMVYFCKHARTFGLVSSQQQLQARVEDLQRRVDELTRQQQQHQGGPGRGDAPPAYSGASVIAPPPYSVGPNGGSSGIIDKPGTGGPVYSTSADYGMAFSPGKI